LANDLAFLNKLATPETPTSPQCTAISDPTNEDNTDKPIPSNITTIKRNHTSSGSTVQPARQKAKQTDTMDVDHNQDDESETTAFGNQHQPETPSNSQSSPTSSEYIPDEQYKFNLAHSQATRLEVIDALAIAKARSKTNYKQTLDYVNNHAQVNVDHLKRLAMAPRRAHNDSTAPHEHPK
jgi:hypothetical protein